MLRNRDNIKTVNKTVKKILRLSEKAKKLTDEELQNQTENFKRRIEKGTSLEKILPEAFAVVREAARRTIGLEHFPVQLVGGIALHKGMIAEMKTGEGKTLVSTCPGYLNALTGKPVYIVTVNDYLAKRDADTMRPVYEMLGMTVGVVLNNMNQFERKQAYSCDVTYVTNNELGFDYLRDNMALDREHQVLRGLDYCIIDEVDSVLIDEARTPLIISGKSDKSTSLYIAADFIAKRLEKGEVDHPFSKIDALMGEDVEESGDFIVEEKEKQAHLTPEGIKKVEDFFHIENLADPKNIDIQHHVNLALRANYIMYRDRDYVVKDDEILIVDEFTGRTMPGRRYSDGLHQAIEAKEKVEVKKESKTYATITFQNFFNKFEKKSGMTGTAKTEEKEFKAIYNMNVLVIPTNKPVIRKDMEDAVYKTKMEKYKAVVQAIKKANQKGQPVLVGTVTIENSELLSRMLAQEGIVHNVLNAKHIEREAQIVEDAGIHGTVTIATNMAGRGTDIKLDDAAKASGGLMIIGTERHESRRIDNQLRGRSGRQGDPGESKFFLSLEDDLMRLFGSEKFKETFEQMGIEEGEEIQHKVLTKAIESAQKRIENNNYGIREQLLKYDEINNEQRELIYEERNNIMDNVNISEVVTGIMVDEARMLINAYFTKKDRTEEEFNKMLIDLHNRIPIKLEPTEWFLMKKNVLMDVIEMQIRDFVEVFEGQFEEKAAAQKVEKSILLKVIDQKWMIHIEDLEKLKESIRLQAYGQKNPITEYKIEAYRMFEELVKNIKESSVRTISHIKVAKKEE